MMKRLDRSQYSRVMPLVRGLDRYLSVRAVLQEDVEGFVYADDVMSPNTYFVWEISGDSGFYLEGEPSESRALEVNRVIREELYAIGNESGRCVDFTLYTYPQTWEEYIPLILKDTYPRRYYRRSFLLDKPKTREIDLPAGFYLSSVDRDFLDGRLEGDGHIRKWVEDPWRSKERFLEKGFGLCIHTDTEAVSWSLADYVSDNRVEIGIQTNEKYRRRGFASMVINAMVNGAIERGFDKIGWHCWGDNDASASTALRAGFNEMEKAQVRNAWFNQIDNTALNGYESLFGLKDYAGAVRHFERAIEMREEAESVPEKTEILETDSDLAAAYWFKGCALAMLSELDRAFESLFKAVELGLERGGQRIESEQLVELRKDRRWSELLRLIEEGDEKSES